MNQCTQCTSLFEITDEDRQFYNKVDVPNPTLCAPCRQQRRAYYRNELNLYHRNCDATGDDVVTMYRPETNVVIYKPDYWWSDKWSPLDYGKQFDFSRPFFEQFHDLQLKVPRLSLYGKSNENSDYTNHTDHARNAYMSADVGFSEDIFYSKWIINSRNLINSYQMERAEQCYMSFYTPDAHFCHFAYLSDASYHSDFLYNCKNVKNSLMCWNLRQKEYCIENKPYSKSEYEKILSTYDTGSYQNVQKYKNRYETLIKQAVRRPLEQINCEDCLGDYIYNSKNLHHCYGVIESRDCAYCYDAGHMNDCYDTYESAFDCELQYESHACNRGKCLIGVSVSYDVSNLYYSEMCHNSEHLFGCIGLRHKKYCIFNKQYSKEEYDALVPKIIAHMKKTGEWGEFFPKELSFFAYNESAAMEFSPLTKEQSIQSGFMWYEDQKDYKLQTYVVPDHIKDVPDNIINEVLACKSCKKNYRVITPELKFYQNHNFPIPHLCPSCRYFEALKWRNPYFIYDRKCDKCSSPIQTTYTPEREEKIYCEDCYLKEVY